MLRQGTPNGAYRAHGTLCTQATIESGVRSVCHVIAGPAREVWERVGRIQREYPTQAYGTHVVDARVFDRMGGGFDWEGDEGIAQGAHGAHAICTVWRSTTSD